MVRILKNIAYSIGQASNTIVVFEVVFKIVTNLCMIPGLVLLFNLMLKVTGYSFITRYNIGSILKNPLSILLFAGILLLAAFVSLAEISMLTVFFGYRFKEKQFYLRNLLYLSLRELRRLANPENFILVLCVVCILPIINFNPIAYYIFGNREIPDYMLGTIMQSGELMVLFAVLAAVLVYLTIQMVFIFCYFFLERKNLAESYRCSRALIKGRVIKTVGSILVCVAFYVLVYIGFYLIIISFVQAGTEFFYEQQIAYAVFLTIFNTINKILIVILGIFQTISVAGIVVELYLQYSKNNRKLYSSTYLQKKMYKKLLYSVNKALLLLLAIVVLVTGTGIYLLLDEQYSILHGEKTLITSHRGFSAMAPENTLASIDAAIEVMADYAEIDVRMTKDGVVVLSHDADLKRTAGVNKKIWQLNYYEIEELDVGSWFSKDFKDERIPTLEQVLEYSKGKIKLNIEIKNSGQNKDFEKKLIGLIEEHDFEDSCIISSFSYDSLKRIKKLNPDIKTGYILSAVYGEFYNLKDVDFFSMRYNFVSERIVTEAHKTGKEIHVWTVNNETIVDRLTRIGVDNIITDDPVMARSIIYSKDFPKSTASFLKLVFNY